jgi:hypothetical protein
VTGFALGDLTIGGVGGTAANLQAFVADFYYTIDVTPAADGEATP